MPPHAGGSGATAAPRSYSSPLWPWLDPSLPDSVRVAALLAKMTPAEKAAQLQSNPNNGISRLGLPDHLWQVKWAATPAPLWEASAASDLRLSLRLNCNDPPALPRRSRFPTYRRWSACTAWTCTADGERRRRGRQRARRSGLSRWPGPRRSTTPWPTPLQARSAMKCEDCTTTNCCS